jgi:YesN/AraC family two-component response regulator
VLAAENGCEALRLLAQNEPVVIHLLLTDVVMPVMGGKELAAKLRPISPQTKIIFCSGYTEDAIFHSGGLEAGVYFLQKPYSVAAVAQKVRDVLNAA